MSVQPGTDIDVHVAGSIVQDDMEILVLRLAIGQPQANDTLSSATLASRFADSTLAFVWTASVASILAKLRDCMPISETIH